MCSFSESYFQRQLINLISELQFEIVDLWMGREYFHICSEYNKTLETVTALLYLHSKKKFKEIQGGKRKKVSYINFSLFFPYYSQNYEHK